MGDDRITQVDVRKAKANDYKEIYEIAKYSAKDSDYLINRDVYLKPFILLLKENN